MATLKLDNVNFVGSAADQKISAHNDDAAAHVRTDASGDQLLTLGGAYSQIGAGRTWITQFATPFAYDAVKVIFANYKTADQVVDKVVVAPCPSNLLAGNAAALSGKWVQATFAGADGGTIPAMVGNVPGLLYSDIVPVLAVERTDSGSNYLTQVRAYTSDNHWMLGISNGASGALASILNITGLEFGCYTDPGDTATTPGSSAPQAQAQYWGIHGLQYYYRGKRVRTICSVGDSISSGVGSSGSSCSDLLILAATTFQNTILAVDAFGQASQPFSVSHEIGKSLVTSLKPTMMKFYAWSPNDGWDTDAKFLTSFARAIDLADLCRRNGILPIICTAAPHVTISGTPEYLARWQAHNERVRSLSSVYTVVDVAAVLESATTPGAYADGLGYSDGIHPSDTGYAAIAAAVSSKLIGIGAI